MIPADFDYRLARSVEEAVGVVEESGGEAKFLAGGMSLIPLMKLRLAQPAVLVDLASLQELKQLRWSEDKVEVGALVRHADLARDPRVLERLPLLAEIAAEVGDRQVRVRGTIGGVLAHADSAGDFCTLALMLDAVIVTNLRRIPASEFFVGFMTTALAPAEIVLTIEFRLDSGRHSYVKFRRRRSDWALVGVAVQELSDGWRIGLTNVASTVSRATAAEERTVDGATNAEVAAVAAASVDPLEDFHTSSDYKRALVRVLTERALDEAGR